MIWEKAEPKIKFVTKRKYGLPSPFNIKDWRRDGLGEVPSAS